MRRLAALLVLPLAACAVGAEPAPGPGDIPAAWRAAAPMAAAWPRPGWWRAFGSPELDGLIAHAEAANFDLQAAAAQVRAADAQLALAGGALLPSVSLGASAAWSHASLVRGAGRTAVEQRTYSLIPQASWELDLWGKLRAARESAAQSALASRYDRAALALTVVTSVASTWFQALAQQDRIDVATRNLADAEEILKAVRARRDAGTASDLDVSQEAALAAGIRAQLPGLRNQLEQQLIALGLLTGQPPAAIAVRPGTLTALALPEIAPGLPSALLVRRPDIAAAEARLLAANANIQAARAAFFPSVTLTGSGGWQSLALATLFGPGSLVAQAAAVASQTIFDNGRLTAQLRLDEATRDALLADYRKTIVQAFSDVDSAAAAYRFATEQEARQRDAVAIAQRAADIARAQVRAGTSDLVAALQAQTTLFNALDLLAQVRLARFQALLSLYKALGGGWTRDDVAAPEIRLFQGVL
jgi:NodT family efflux transporter outer membrane factor (OMF) lipoprotein